MTFDLLEPIATDIGRAKRLAAAHLRQRDVELPAEPTTESAV